MIVVDFDCSPLILLQDMFEKYHPKQVTARIAVGWTADPNWPALLGWVEQIHKRKCVGWSGLSEGYEIGDDDSVRAELEVIKAIFEIASMKLSLSWQQMSEVLETQHKVLIRLDPRWK